MNDESLITLVKFHGVTMVVSVLKRERPHCFFRLRSTIWSCLLLESRSGARIIAAVFYYLAI